MINSADFQPKIYLAALYCLSLEQYTWSSLMKFDTRKLSSSICPKLLNEFVSCSSRGPKSDIRLLKSLKLKSDDRNFHLRNFCNWLCRDLQLSLVLNHFFLNLWEGGYMSRFGYLDNVTQFFGDCRFPLLHLDSLTKNEYK